VSEIMPFPTNAILTAKTSLIEQSSDATYRLATVFAWAVLVVKVKATD
jgi:hypothetical protein